MRIVLLDQISNVTRITKGQRSQFLETGPYQTLQFVIGYRVTTQIEMGQIFVEVPKRFERILIERVTIDKGDLTDFRVRTEQLR